MIVTTKTSTGTTLLMTLLVLLVGLPGLQDVAAEEYWRDYIHLETADSFDGEPMTLGPLSREEARADGSYTVVRRDERGRVLEAVAMLRGEPNYFYAYVYDGPDLVYRRMYAVLREGEQKLSEVLYGYQDGALRSAGLYVYDLFGRRRQRYLKIYTGPNYVLYENELPQSGKDSEVLESLERISRQLDELQRLESRGLIRRVLGIR